MTPAELLAALAEERDTFRAFGELLEQEAAALDTGNADALLAIAQAKVDKVVTLNRLSEARNRFLTSRGLPGDQPGMAALLATQQVVPEHTALQTVWSELLDAAKAARERNYANGVAIELKLQHNQQALAVLQAAANRGSTLYGPDGQALAGAGARHLDKV